VNVIEYLASTKDGFVGTFSNGIVIADRNNDAVFSTIRLYEESILGEIEPDENNFNMSSCEYGDNCLLSIILKF